MVERAGDAPPPLILASVPAPYGMGGKPVYPDSARGRDQRLGMGETGCKVAENSRSDHRESRTEMLGHSPSPAFSNPGQAKMCYNKSNEGGNPASPETEGKVAYVREIRLPRAHLGFRAGR